MAQISDISQQMAPIFDEYGVERAFVFGSVARGDAGPDSDIDVRVERPLYFKIREMLSLKKDLEFACGTSVDLVTSPKSRMRPAFSRALDRDEVLIFGD